MTATPICKPWCDDHQDGAECYTSYTIYSEGKDDSLKVEPTPGSPAAQLQALGGWSGDISMICFVASQDEEDEHPQMNLQFFEAGKDETYLQLDLAGLKQLHANLGEILQDFS